MSKMSKPSIRALPGTLAQLLPKLFPTYLYLAPVTARPSPTTSPWLSGTVRNYRNEAFLLCCLCCVSTVPTWAEVKFTVVIYGYLDHVFWSQLLLSVVTRVIIAYLSVWSVFLPRMLWHSPSDLWRAMRRTFSPTDGTWTAGYSETVWCTFWYNLVWFVGWFMYTVVIHFRELQGAQGHKLQGVEGH